MINIGNESFSHIPASLQCSTSSVCVYVSIVCVSYFLCVCVCMSIVLPLQQIWNLNNPGVLLAYVVGRPGFSRVSFSSAFLQELLDGERRADRMGKTENKGLYISSELRLPCAALLCDGPSSFKSSPPNELLALLLTSQTSWPDLSESFPTAPLCCLILPCSLATEWSALGQQRLAQLKFRRDISLVFKICHPLGHPGPWSDLCVRGELHGESGTFSSSSLTPF